MPSADQAPAETPNEVLTKRIIKELTENGLLAAKYVAVAEQKMLMGRASGSDWQLWAEEIIIAKEQANAKASPD